MLVTVFCFVADLVPEDQFDVELIVQCIRSSENPRTHTQALLLLATSAKLFPVNLLKVFHKLGGTPVSGFLKFVVSNSGQAIL